MAKSQAVANIERAKTKKVAVNAGRYLSNSQLGALINPENYTEENRPDGFVFQVGRIEGTTRTFTIEIVPYVYDPIAPNGLKYLSYTEDGLEIEGYLNINLGLQRPDEIDFPKPGESNDYRINNSEGGGGLGAAQAYPTPGH